MLLSSSKLVLALAAIGVLGCASKEPEEPPGQIGGEPYACEAKATQTLGIDEESPLGFSASEVLAFAQASHDAGFVWNAGGSTAGTLTVASPSEVRFADLGSPPVGDPQFFGEIACYDHLELDTIVTLDTADGGFAETFDATLLVASASRVVFSKTVAPDGIGGTYVFDERDPATYDEVESLTFNGTIEPMGAFGDVHALLSTNPSSEGDGVVSAENVTIATFAP